MKICFIINPKSGAKGKENFVRDIERFMDRSRHDLQIRFTEGPRHATALAKEYSDKGFDLVVSVGGDGSANETGAGLVNTSTAMGIIPAGSGNGMARHLGIPMNFQKAVELINDCTIRKIDTLTANGHFCIGTIGVGFDAHIAHLFSKAGTRGYSTYVKLVLREFASYKPIHFILHIDGKVTEESCFLLTFANSSQFGNNAVIAPFADEQDGVIDVSIMRKFPLYSAPHLIYRLMHNSIYRSKFYSTFRGKDILVKNTGKMIGHIDGEPVEFSGDLHIQIQPLSLYMATPSTKPVFHQAK